MCLLACAWDHHPRYRLVIAGNRDEWHRRPAAAADWWDDHPNVLGGRDLEAGGTWLGVARSGKAAVVTNLPNAGSPDPDISRGHLVTGFLTGEQDAQDYSKAVADEATRYAGFNLLVADDESLGFVSNHDESPRAAPLPSGVSTITNSGPDVDWPKAAWLREQVTEALAQDHVETSVLLDMLARRDPVSAPLADGDAARVATTPFIVLGEYGTRASTVLLVEHSGEVTFVERTYDAGGAVTGDRTFAFLLA